MLVIMKSLMSVVGVASISVLAMGATSVPNTFKTGEPAKAAEVNENCSTLSSAIDSNSSDISALSKPGIGYSILSSETLDSGLVRTKLYAYELNDYKNLGELTPAGGYLGTGSEYVVNALGEFRGDWHYAEYGGIRSIAGESTTSPVACQDGSAMTRSPLDTDYFLTWRNERGALIFANRGTANSGIYYGCNDFTSDAGVTYSFGEYYYLEGKGVGIYSCVDRAVWHGAFLRHPNSFWEKTYVPSRTDYPHSVAGVFDRSTNGLWGTYYLEIDAPADCLKLN